MDTGENIVEGRSESTIYITDQLTAQEAGVGRP